MSPYARSLQKLSLVVVQAKEPEAVPEVWTPALMMLTTTPEVAVRGLCDYDIEVGMPVLGAGGFPGTVGWQPLGGLGTRVPGPRSRGAAPATPATSAE